MRTKSKQLINEILDVIDAYQAEFGAAPSTREIAAKTGYSNGNISNYINYMEQEGMLVRNGVRSIVTARSQNRFSAATIPIVGRVPCGPFNLAEENVEGYVQVPGSILGKGTYFFLKAKGSSMIDAGINDGALVLIHRQETADQGQIIVALVDGEATLKRYYPRPEIGKVILRPANSEMEPMEVNPDTQEFIIQGVAVKAINVINLE